MKKEQVDIWNYLIVHALGKQNAIHVNDIANALQIPDQGTNNDNVRNWITDMVKNHGKQIGTCVKGVFIILSDIECEDAAKFVERKTRSNAIRRNGYYIPQ